MMSDDSRKDEPPLSTKEQFNQAILIQWVISGWEGNDPDVVADHFHPDCIVYGMAPEVLEGVAQVQAAHRAICGRLHHRTARVTEILVRGDRFAGVMMMEGCHRDTDIDVAFEVSCIGEMKDGLMYRSHNTIDYTGLYAKLGILNTEKMREFFS